MFLCMAGADVRVRVRPGVIRVRIAEAGIRPVIRVTTPEAEGSPFPFLPTGHRAACVAVAGPCYGPRRSGFIVDYRIRISMNLQTQK